jgi:hypothetical protein
MNSSGKTLTSRLARAALAFSLTALAASSANAQKTDAAPQATSTITPYSLFQESTLTASTNTVNVTRVPAVDSSNKVHYWDVALLFDTNSEGKLTLANGYPIFTASATPYSGNFKPGTYMGGGLTQYKIVVSGPSVLPNGGTGWAIFLAEGSNGDTAPNNAVWYAESITSNPLASRIKAAGISNSQLFYGVGGGGFHIFGWSGDSLLGFSQIGNALTILNFTNGPDQNTPQDQVTFVYPVNPVSERTALQQPGLVSKRHGLPRVVPIS